MGIGLYARIYGGNRMRREPGVGGRNWDEGAEDGKKMRKSALWAPPLSGVGDDRCES